MNSSFDKIEMMVKHGPSIHKFIRTFNCIADVFVSRFHFYCSLLQDIRKLYNNCNKLCPFHKNCATTAFLGIGLLFNL